VTQQTHAFSNADGHPDHLDLWLRVSRGRRRRPAPPSLVVVRCVYAAVLLAVVVGMPHLLRGVASG
jgi:hypothetical protein